MAIRGPLLVLFLALICLVATTHGAKPSPLVPFSRSSFPPGFLFGAGSAAYQIEGAALIDGRGFSIWDKFTREHPEKIWDRSNGDVASDFYHKFKDDIKLMKRVGLDTFRLSFSWSRILPKGKVSRGVNPLGVKFYNNVINELLHNGIKPLVTLLHYDPPQSLYDEYGGFLSSKIVDDFAEYADFCFKTFGDRVKYWITMNEPNGLAINGYTFGSFAPGRCSKTLGNCPGGNSAVEPYVAAHNMILSHGAAVKVYKDKYQAIQKGQIGITIVSHWFVPKFNTTADRIAVSRALDFMFGWFAHPITFGDYPDSMRSLVGNRLPKFTKEQSAMLKGSLDFLGLNYYTTNYAESIPLKATGANLSYTDDRRVSQTTEKNGVPIGTPTDLNWLYVYPRGIQDVLLYIKYNYKNPPVFITENGIAENASRPIAFALKDSWRIRYHSAHLSYLLKAIQKGANVKAYYIWSFLDDFEWDAGYTVRFGVTYVDFKNNLKRYLKSSARWFQLLLKK
ncbi:hypothetical protein POPTR_001G227200v4 [Populus trichocarpa]|uniref:Glycoside hydrolase n=1 Tax=Populus trichocarpa TaxID=3694 RepID=A0A2K2C246_POPTR|nr:vicianin hydrolase [Populus trichocarpa]PNT56093.1 hypothetical protein POPTR_001G227200v4 [Populus trichocarpa]|eukprot:XP_006369438.2 vicianin hydrolase [Populus trichocarpa]